MTFAEFADRVADRWPLLACLLFVASWFPLAKHHAARHHPQENRPVPRAIPIRGYLRRRGPAWEFGIYHVDTGIRRPLGRRRRRGAAAEALNQFMNPTTRDQPEEHHE